MNVLSLFDGISCGQIAINSLGVDYTYYASEIDSKAIEVTKSNFPYTKHLGDIRAIDSNLLPDIDLLIGGSPCQGFSIAGKRLNFKDERSKLFFEYLRVLEECKPKYFLFENVIMADDVRDAISELLGFHPIMINSKLLSCQDRKRYYWTNIPDVKQPVDLKVKFTDISYDGYFAASMRGRRVNAMGVRSDDNPAIKMKQYIECRRDDKIGCLTTVAKDTVAVKSKYYRILAKDCKWRYLHPIEAERAQTVPDNYTSSISNSQRLKVLGNGWTVEVIKHILCRMSFVSIQKESLYPNTKKMQLTIF